MEPCSAPALRAPPGLLDVYHTAIWRSVHSHDLARGGFGGALEGGSAAFVTDISSLGRREIYVARRARTTPVRMPPRKPATFPSAFFEPAPRPSRSVKEATAASGTSPICARRIMRPEREQGSHEQSHRDRKHCVLLRLPFRHRRSGHRRQWGFRRCCDKLRDEYGVQSSTAEELCHTGREKASARGVPRREGAHLVAAHEQIQAVRAEDEALAKPANFHVRFTRCVEWHRILRVRRVVDQLHTRSVHKHRCGVIRGDWPHALNRDRLGVRTQGGHADRGARDRHIRRVKDFARLPRHFHLLLRVAIVLELVNVRDHVEWQRVSENLVPRRAPAHMLLNAPLQFLHALRPGA